MLLRARAAVRPLILKLGSKGDVGTLSNSWKFHRMHAGSGREGKASSSASARASGPLFGGSDGSVLTNQPKVAPTEASVYQDLIKAAQVSRMVLT